LRINKSLHDLVVKSLFCFLVGLFLLLQRDKTALCIVSTDRFFLEKSRFPEFFQYNFLPLQSQIKEFLEFH